MSTPADPNLSGSYDPNAADQVQGTQDQTEHRGTPGEQTAPYPQAPGDERSDDRARPVAGPDGGEEGTNEGGHSTVYVPTTQTEGQSAPGTVPDTDPELGGGKGEGSSPRALPANERPAVDQDPDNPAVPHGTNTPHRPY